MPGHGGPLQELATVELRGESEAIGMLVGSICFFALCSPLTDGYEMLWEGAGRTI
jgi:hypothetical protein